MKLVVLFLNLFLLNSAFAAPKIHTLIQCGIFKVIYSEKPPSFAYGDVLKNTPSKNDQWAIVDGYFENADTVKFVDEVGKYHSVQMHREIAYQYRKYVIQQDIIDVPDHNPAGDLGSPTSIYVLRDPKEGASAGIFGPSEDTHCTIKQNF